MKRVRKEQLHIPTSLAEDHSSTQQLIAAIESKDRRFRFFQMMFMFGTLIALIIVIGAQWQTLKAVEAQLVQAKDVAVKQAARDKASDDRIERRLNCMVVFFSQKDRTSLSIDNVDNCTLNRDGALDQFFQSDDPDGSQSPSTTPPNEPVSPVSAAPVVTPPPMTNTPPRFNTPVPTAPPDPQGILGLGIQLPFGITL